MKHIQLDHSSHTNTASKYSLCFLAHDIETPMNIGSLFRVADAMGVAKIFLTGHSSIPPNPKIKKTSRAAEKYVAYEHQPSPLDVVQMLKEQGYKIISLEITSDSISLHDLVLPQDEKVCLILGSESTGVCQALLDASDTCIHIPMLGHNSSMNVANACSIATYELTRQMHMTT